MNLDDQEVGECGSDLLHNLNNLLFIYRFNKIIGISYAHIGRSEYKPFNDIRP